MRLPDYLLIATLAAGLAACQTIAMTGATETASAAADQRTLGEAVDDVSIYAEVNHYFMQSDVNDLMPHVNITVRQGRVLLTGKVEKEETIGQAEEQAWKAGGVREVINEIELAPGSGIRQSAHDQWVEKQLEARLTVTKGVNIFNFSVDVVNGTAYMLGLVRDEAELNRVVRVAATVKGVKRVVSHLRTFSQNSNPNPAIL